MLNTDTESNGLCKSDVNRNAVEKILSAPPVAESGRHLDGIKRLRQLRSNGMDRESAVQAVLELYPHGSGTHRKINKAEFYRAYDDAVKLPLEPWATVQPRQGYSVQKSQEPRIKLYVHDGSTEELPSDEIKLPFSKFLKDVLGFRDDEYAWFATTEEAWGGEQDGETYLSQWKIGTSVRSLTEERKIGDTPQGETLDDRSGIGFSSLGTYFVINPLKDGEARKNDNVSRYLYTLVESDLLSLELQLAIYRRSNLPIKALIYSGGDSVHAIVRVDAASLEEYRERVRFIHDFLGGKEQGFDTTIDPVRFSRLPNSLRGGSRQRLLETNIGAANWDEWKGQLQFDGLPELLDMAELLEELEQKIITEPKPLVQNLLHKEEVAIFGAASKSFKSWTMMELALAVSQGSKFLKWEAYAGKVLYVDTELTKFHFTKRMASIAKATGCGSLSKGEITPLLLRGTRTKLDDLVPALKVLAKGYDLICIDAIYSVLGEREENSNDHIAAIGALLLELSVATGAAVVFTHHFSKGSQIGKRGIEKASGAGSWGRFPDVSLSIDQHPNDGCFNFEVDARNRPQQPMFVARRNGPVWDMQTGLKPEHKTNNNRSSITEILDILVNECGGEASPGDWFTACEQKLSISRKVFDGRKEKAEKQKLISQAGNTSNTVCRLAKSVAKDTESGWYELPKPTFTAIKSE